MTKEALNKAYNAVHRNDKRAFDKAMENLSVQDQGDVLLAVHRARPKQK
jgi:hypothetical protein